MRKLSLAGVKENTGYYVSEDGTLYKIDFSQELLTPQQSTDVDIDFIPTRYKLLNINKGVLEKSLKEKIDDVTTHLEKALDEENPEKVNEIKKKIITSVYNWMYSISTSKLIPNEIYVKSDIYGFTYIAGKVYFEESVKNVWNKDINYDVTMMKELPGTYRDGMVVFIHDFSNMKSPVFYVVDEETTKKIEKLISQYCYIDANDVDGHRLRGLVIYDVNLEKIAEILDIPGEKVEKYFIRLREERKKRSIRELLQLKEKLEKLNLPYTEAVIDKINEKIVVFYKGKLFAEVASDTCMNEILIILKEKVEEDLLIEKVKNKEIPVLRVKSESGEVKFEIYLDKIIEVPKDLLPHIIGKKGEYVKKLEKILGKKVKLVETKPLNISRKDRIEKPLRFLYL